jgi:hypothetical protein
MLMGFTIGVAGILYIGVGCLQELIGLTSAMSLSYLSLIPAALLAFYVLTKYHISDVEQAPVDISSCVCSPGLEANIRACPCRTG